MIVVDGRTDEEKLRELLGAGAEETALDFKSTLDLGQRTSKDVLDFVKDCVAMGNLPSGGYIVVGVADDGTPAHDLDPVDVTKFDSADLGARVKRYVEAPVHMVSKPHVVDGRDVVLVYVEPNSDGLPVPFSAIGQYQDSDGGMSTVFRAGEVVIREGTANVRLRYAHWKGLLRSYRERLRAEARSDADALIAQVVAAIGKGGATTSDTTPPVPPLVVGMDWPTLDEALLAHLESPNVIRLQRFLEEALHAVVEGFERSDEGAASSYDAALDTLAVVAINAARYNRDDIYALAVSTLRDAYEAGGRARTMNAGEIGSDLPSTRHWLAVVERVMAVGRGVVAARRFSLLPDLVHRQVHVGSDYSYESWIRHAQVAASRRELLARSGGALLSAVRQMLGARPWLRPDVTTPSGFTPGDQLDPDDRLLNELATVRPVVVRHGCDPQHRSAGPRVLPELCSASPVPSTARH